jgi:hypothetical protein
MWAGNEKWMHSKNSRKLIYVVADIQTICGDCSSRVGLVPTIPAGVANSLGLNSMDSL